MREGYLDQNRNRSKGSFQVANPDSRSDGRKWLSIEEVRELTCLAVKPQSIPDSSMRSNTKNAVYSIRVSADSKEEIRGHLKNIYGYTHATIYPDFPGFSAYWAKRTLE
jgi:hypothetical protein